MLSATLIAVSICLFLWLSVEIRWAFRLAKEGRPVEATVSRREWMPSGRKRRNLTIMLTVIDEVETKVYPMGYVSFFGYRNLQVGDKITVLLHPAWNYVIPAGKAGLIARPFIAAALFVTSATCATAFTLATLQK
jgi:hypothetical protein